jgi:membrane protease subunit HflK
VTRERMYLETMERVLGSTDKTIIDAGPGGNGVVPYLALPALGQTTRPSTSTSTPGGRQ